MTVRQVQKHLIEAAKNEVGKGWARLSQDERLSLIREQAWIMVQNRHEPGEKTAIVGDIVQAMTAIYSLDEV